MKKAIMLVIVCIMVFIGCASAEESLLRGKSINITRTEWLSRYAAVPAVFVGSETPIYPVRLVEDDYRVYYLATPIEDVNVVLVCEDTTDLVVSAAVMIDLTALDDDFNLGKKIGEFINEFVRRSAFATNPNTSSDWISNELFAIIDVAAINEKSEVDNALDKDGIRYVFSYSDGELFYGLRNAYTFNSEEEFLTYRDSTL